MDYRRDMGECCLILPLKLGVGLISMYIFAYSFVCMVALFSLDIRMESGGYSRNLHWLSPIVGVFGLAFGFIGLLGVFDDKPAWLKAFLFFMIGKLACAGLLFTADFLTLRLCSIWMDDPIRIAEMNAAMEELYTSKACPEAKTSYILGFSLEFAFNLYCTFHVWQYIRLLDLNMPYPVDFNYDKYNKFQRWKYFHVKDPDAFVCKTEEEQPMLGEEELDDNDVEFGPDGFAIDPAAPPAYNPDGTIMRNA